jgi:hypothetical protein
MIIKKNDPAVQIMCGELKSMIPTFLVCNAILLLSCGIYGLFNTIDWRIFTGLFAGNAAAVLNFYHLGVKAGNITRMKDARRARIYATASFFVRYIGALIVFGLLIRFGLMNVVTAVIPLLFPKIHYTVKAIFNKI